MRFFFLAVVELLLLSTQFVSVFFNADGVKPEPVCRRQFDVKAGKCAAEFSAFRSDVAAGFPST